MADRIAFLHTSPVHVATFGALLRAQAPDLQAWHAVDESLLADAQRLGTDDPGVQQRVHRAMANAAAGSGARIVVCTCSTLGALAESTPTGGAFEAMRVDRAMADRAAELGPRVLMVVALASTVAPTCELLAESAARLGRSISIDGLVLADAWAHFQRGDQAAYLAAVASAARAGAANADVIVLAQASMAGAAEALADLNIEVLSSPALGVARAIERLRASLYTSLYTRAQAHTADT